MKDEDLFNFYEKMYFHELETREHLNGRLQIPLTIIVVLLSFLAYIFTNSNANEYNFWCYSFIFFIIVSSIATVTAIYYFFTSYLNFGYKYLPSATTIKTYRQQLIDLYKPYDNGSELVENYTKQTFYDYFANASSVNTEINAERAYFVHKTNLYILIAIITSIIACIPYFFGDIGKSSKTEPTKVIITNPIQIMR